MIKLSSIVINFVFINKSEQKQSQTIVFKVQSADEYGLKYNSHIIVAEYSFKFCNHGVIDIHKLAGRAAQIFFCIAIIEIQRQIAIKNRCDNLSLVNTGVVFVGEFQKQSSAVP